MEQTNCSPKSALSLIFSALALVGVVVLAILNFSSKTPELAGSEGQVNQYESHSADIAYFNLDRVLNEYDMALDLSTEVQTKVNSINAEVNRRGSKLEKDITAFQEKINKGLLTQSVANAQSEQLSQQQQEFEQYTVQKQQEIAEEQQVMMNRIADAINTYISEFNSDKQYSLILATQGDILPAPVVNAAEELNITDVLLEGLNAEYAKSKSAK